MPQTYPKTVSGGFWWLGGNRRCLIGYPATTGWATPSGDHILHPFHNGGVNEATVDTIAEGSKGKDTATTSHAAHARALDARLMKDRWYAEPCYSCLCESECSWCTVSRPNNSIAFGSAPRREAVSHLDRPAVRQTETHSLGFLSVADTGPSGGENKWS